MFGELEEQIPSGWQLCNGSGETSNGIKVPDLRDRFIVGAGSGYDPGKTGGSTSATSSSNGSHSHNVTVNSGGSHSHTVTVNSHTLTGSQAPSHSHEASFDYCDVASGGSYGITAQGGRRPQGNKGVTVCLLYTSPSPRDRQKSRMPSSA